ncbi:unnamed protein product [Caenorhabditis bovis]|uniref:AB hydrolase-1 domain-containing protein n=1 Tax=Caenorhabditis bovis TaxID=2654633 RepID=A0A8S1EBT8_9PELO|nr:unnamed protein product [Caenorhabditis bovis]
MAESNIFKKNVVFRAISGKQIELEAVYEDSLPSGSSIGTVIAVHGSPGSHKDFKYVREKLNEMKIRFIGVNFPGFCNTPGYPGQDFGNEERHAFSNALIEELNIPGKIIIMGHSRGNENALMTAVEKNVHGLVMINPIGFRRHKGISPKFSLEGLEWAYDCLPSFIGNAMIYKVYQMIGFKVKSAEECINALRTMNRCYLDKQLEHVEKLNKSNTKVMFLFAGKDHLMEQEIMFEALDKYYGLKHFEFDKKIPQEEMKPILEEISSGAKGVSVFVKNDNHFQNKSQAELVANVTQRMLNDSLPSGSNVGTLVGFHGAFGSHNDFMHILQCMDRRIRFIGINYPGFGFTAAYPGQSFCNTERQNFTNSLLDSLQINGKIVYIGHSRGCENALMTSVERKETCQGLVIINPVGLRPSKTIILLKYLKMFYGILPKSLAEYFIFHAYTIYGFKHLPNGRAAINSIETVLSTALNKKLPYIEKFNETNHKLFLIHSGNDFVIEPEIIEELLDKYKGLEHFRFENDIDEFSENAILKALRNSKRASVYVQNDDHFQNKTRCDLIAKAIQTIFY